MHRGPEQRRLRMQRTDTGDGVEWGSEEAEGERCKRDREVERKRGGVEGGRERAVGWGEKRREGFHRAYAAGCSPGASHTRFPRLPCLYLS